MTAQVPDRLIHRGSTLSLCATPLEPYLKRLRIARRPEFVQVSTAILRGYVATWEIIDRHLFLTGIEGFVLGADDRFEEASLTRCFPERTYPIPATWVVDEVRCPEGRLRQYEHNMFRSVYERDRFFWFDRGELMRERLVYNPPNPLEYHIEADGRRVYIDEGKAAPDPFPADQPVEPWRLWGDPNWEVPGGDGYLVAAAYVRALGDAGSAD